MISAIRDPSYGQVIFTRRFTIPAIGTFENFLRIADKMKLRLNNQMGFSVHDFARTLQELTTVH